MNQISYRRRDRNGRRSRLWLMVEVCCAVIFLILIGIIVSRLLHNREIAREEDASRADFQQLQNEIVENVSEEENLVEDIPPVAVAEPPEMLGYFQPLMEQNADIRGMVSFGKDMALYVCQAEDNLYYGTHRFDGSEDPAGMIFMDCRCMIWPRSENVVLYGHNMKDGSRFGTLKRFIEPEYLLEYPLLQFSSLYELDAYIPFSIFYTTVEEESEAYFDFAQVWFESDAAFDAYVQHVKDASILELNVDVQRGDALLTLATCSEAYDGGRLVMVCRRLREGE